MSRTYVTNEHVAEIDIIALDPDGAAGKSQPVSRCPVFRVNTQREPPFNLGRLGGPFRALFIKCMSDVLFCEEKNRFVEIAICFQQCLLCLLRREAHVG